MLGQTTFIFLKAVVSATAAENFAGNEQEIIEATALEVPAVSSAPAVLTTSDTAREIIYSLIRAATSPRKPIARSPFSSPSSPSSFQTDPLPQPPVYLPVLKIPEGGIDRYDDHAPQFARECLRELEERGVLVLNCGGYASFSSCLHLATRALTRYVCDDISL
jgi:hypothetical protein